MAVTNRNTIPSRDADRCFQATQIIRPLLLSLVILGGRAERFQELSPSTRRRVQRLDRLRRPVRQSAAAVPNSIRVAGSGVLTTMFCTENRCWEGNVPPGGSGEYA